MLQVLPHVFSALEANARSHWNPAVHGLTCNVRKMFQEMDEELYEECRQSYEKDEVSSCWSLGRTTAAGGWGHSAMRQSAAVVGALPSGTGTPGRS